MRLIFTAFLIVICGVGPARAEDEASPAAATQSPAAGGGPDFLFGRPNGWITLSATWLVPRAGGDLFTFVSDQLTIDRSDFRTHAFTGSVGVALPGRLDVVGDVEIGRRVVPSEYRKFVKADRSEIAQTTQFDQATLGVGVRYWPIGRGENISRFAFLPRRLAPFVGGGASFVHYTFVQQGEFVDFVDFSIFNHSFRSTGWSIGPHVDGGAELQIWRMFFLDVAVRYAWAHSALSRDFEGFDGIDLAGFKSSTGLTIVF